MEVFSPIITHRQFTDFVSPLELDRQQRMIAELAFSDYTDAIHDLAARADAAADEVGRQTLQSVYSGRQYLPAEQLRELRVSVYQTYLDAVPGVDVQMMNLTSTVQSLLQPQQHDAFEQSMRDLRRAVYLHPRQSERSAFEYAGDGVDLLILLERATRNENELAALPGDAVASIRNSYEADLDELLVQSATEYRDAQLHLRLARISEDNDSYREAEQALLENWQQLYDLNQRTAREVSRLAAQHLGDDAKSAWEDRFARACFPWMFSPDLPDRQRDWLDEQDLSEEQRQRAAQAYEAFTRQRDELRQDALDLMLTARRELKTIIYPMMRRSDIADPLARPLHTQLLHNSGKLSSAEAKAARQLESLLDRDQRADMRRAMER